MKCYNCGEELPEGSLLCYRCGAKNDAPKTPTKNSSTLGAVIGVVSSVAVLAVACLGVWITQFDPFNSKSDKDKAPISGTTTAIITTLTTTATTTTPVTTTPAPQTTTTAATTTTTTTSVTTTQKPSEPAPASNPIIGAWEFTEDNMKQCIVFTSDGYAYSYGKRVKCRIIPEKNMIIFTEQPDGNGNFGALSYKISNNLCITTSGTAKPDGTGFKKMTGDGSVTSLKRVKTTESTDKFLGLWIMQYIIINDNDEAETYYDPILIEKNKIITVGSDSEVTYKVNGSTITINNSGNEFKYQIQIINDDQMSWIVPFSDEFYNLSRIK